MLKPIKGVKHCANDSTDLDVDEKLHDMELRLKNQQRMLQRLYRKLEKEEGENKMKLNKLAEQRKLIRMMRKEKQDLMFLKKMTPDGDPNIQKVTKAVREIMDIYETQFELVEDCADSLVEIGNCVDYVIKIMYKYRKTIQRNFGNLKTSQDYAQRQDTLENRLYMYTVKLNTLVRECEHVKQEINDWLEDRGKYYRRFKRYKHQIGQSKTLMNALVAKANTAYDKYDDLRLQDKLIKKRNSMECQVLVSDLKDSVRFLRSDRYLRDFIKTKCQHRLLIEVDSDRIRRRMHSVLTNTRRLIPQYRRAFKLISDESGYPNVDHTLHVYLETEQHNFATFRYIINLQDEIYVMEGEIIAMREKIFKQKKYRTALHNGYGKNLRLHKKDNFDLNIERAKAMETLQIARSDAEKLVEQINKLFNLAGCDEKALRKFLGNTHGLAVVNVISFLRILEIRTTLLLRRREAMQRARMGSRQAAGPATFVSGQRASQFSKIRSFGGPFQPLVTIPNSFDTGENDEEDKKFSIRPLTYAEHRENCQTLASHAASFIKAFVRTESGDEESNHSDPL